MGNRLSKIATRTGDAGMTGLGDGSRVEKDHLRICAMGDVDELNSQIGVLMTEEFPESIASDPNLPPLKEFILPGGTRAAAQAHICRTVCRRAERSIVKLGWADPINDSPRQYVNRLSDLLFVLARVLNRAAGGKMFCGKTKTKSTGPTKRKKRT